MTDTVTEAVAQAIGRVSWGSEVIPKGKWIEAANAAISTYKQCLEDESTSGNSLISRLQDATEGSRELSDSVLLVMGWKHVPASNSWYEQDNTYRGGAPDRPDPTRNLADGLALMPKGWGWLLETQGDECFATVNYPVYGHHHLFKDVPGATPELAMIIAALHAREMNTND